MSDEVVPATQAVAQAAMAAVPAATVDCAADTRAAVAVAVKVTGLPLMPPPAAVAVSVFVPAVVPRVQLVTVAMPPALVRIAVGGTTEPLEFLFLFVAPLLYLIHALLTGLGFTMMAVLDVTIGNTDGNLIDFVVFGILHGLSTRWYMVPVVAAIWFVAYYAIFRFAITRWKRHPKVSMVVTIGLALLLVHAIVFLFVYNFVPSYFIQAAQKDYRDYKEIETIIRNVYLVLGWISNSAAALAFAVLLTGIFMRRKPVAEFARRERWDGPPFGPAAAR